MNLPIHIVYAPGIQLFRERLSEKARGQGRSQKKVRTEAISMDEFPAWLFNEGLYDDYL